MFKNNELFNSTKTNTPFQQKRNIFKSKPFVSSTAFGLGLSAIFVGSAGANESDLSYVPAPVVKTVNMEDCLNLTYGINTSKYRGGTLIEATGKTFKDVVRQIQYSHKDRTITNCPQYFDFMTQVEIPGIVRAANEQGIAVSPEILGINVVTRDGGMNLPDSHKFSGMGLAFSVLAALRLGDLGISEENLPSDLRPNLNSNFECRYKDYMNSRKPRAERGDRLIQVTARVNADGTKTIKATDNLIRPGVGTRAANQYPAYGGLPDIFSIKPFDAIPSCS